MPVTTGDDRTVIGGEECSKLVLRRSPVYLGFCSNRSNQPVTLSL